MKSFQIANRLTRIAALAAAFFPISATAQQYNISTVAGSAGSQGFYGDGCTAVATSATCTGAELNNPIRVAVDSKGNIYIVDSLNYVIREVSGGIIDTVAGDGSPSAAINITSAELGDNGSALQANISDVHGIAVDSKGNIYLADTGNSRVRKVNVSTATSANTTSTGDTGAQSDIIDVTSTKGIVVGMLISGAGIAPETLVTLIKGNTLSLNIGTAAAVPAGTPLQLSLTTITTYAGNGTVGYSGDGGMATSASLYRPVGVAVDSNDNLYIADTGNATVRKVTSSGTISTIAGTGTIGYSGDGGPASKAMLGAPDAIAFDPAGNLYIGDTINANIREITTDGNIHTVATNIDAESLAIDAAGNIYYPDYAAQTIQKLFPNGDQLTIAGNGTAGYSGDGGPATGAQFNLPYGVALDSSGNIYVADSQNEIIRQLTPVTSSIGVVSAASGFGGSVAPGEIVVLYGTGIGPATLTVNTPVNGFFGPQVAGTTVSFDGNPAPMIYSSATQVAAIVPYEEAIGNTANVKLTYQGQTLTTTVLIAGEVPGLFTANASGSGQAAALNYTVNGTTATVSLNSATNPAPVGSYISIFATGAGSTSPGSVDGQIAVAPNLPVPVQQIRATVAGMPAVVSYAGAAPGLVAGLLQVNLQIPMISFQTGAPPVSVPVELFVAGLPSQTAVTIYVSAQ